MLFATLTSQFTLQIFKKIVQDNDQLRQEIGVKSDDIRSLLLTLSMNSSPVLLVPSPPVTVTAVLSTSPIFNSSPSVILNHTMDKQVQMILTLADSFS
jgi:hypothetical protein